SIGRLRTGIRIRLRMVSPGWRTRPACLARASSPSRTFVSLLKSKKSLFRRDAETNTRDACVTRNRLPLSPLRVPFEQSAGRNEDEQDPKCTNNSRTRRQVAVEGPEQAADSS